jgi:hypothetical protein
MPIPTYTAGYPPDKSTLGQTKTQIRNNLDGTFQTLAVDHFDNNNINAGKHKYVHLVTQVSNPALASSEGALFTKIVGPNTELFYRYGSAPQNTYQLTNNGAIAAVNGFTSLVSPDGGAMAMYWGNSAVTSGVHNISYGVTFSAIYNVQITPIATSGTPTNGIFIQSVANNQFTYNNASSTINQVYWIAIGKT